MYFYFYFIKNHADYLMFFREIIAATFCYSQSHRTNQKDIFLGLFNSEGTNIFRNVGNSDLNDTV